VHHYRAAKRILRYLAGTKSLGLYFKSLHGRNHPSLIAYSDADFAGDHSTRKSTTGTAILLAGAPIFFKSQRQRSVSLSTAEAELVALTHAGKEVSYLRKLLHELNFIRVHGSGSESTPICCDNAAAVLIAQQTMYRGRMRHLDVSQRYICELVDRKQVIIQQVSSDDQLADLFTKPLQRPVFESLRGRLGMGSFLISE
jgi:hypothetical protein